MREGFVGTDLSGAEWTLPLGLTADDEIVEVDWRLDFDAVFSVLSGFFVSAAYMEINYVCPLRDLEHMSISQSVVNDLP